MIEVDLEAEYGHGLFMQQREGVVRVDCLHLSDECLGPQGIVRSSPHLTFRTSPPVCQFRNDARSLFRPTTVDRCALRRPLNPTRACVIPAGSPRAVHHASSRTDHPTVVRSRPCRGFADEDAMTSFPRTGDPRYGRLSVQRSVITRRSLLLHTNYAYPRSH